MNIAFHINIHVSYLCSCFMNTSIHIVLFYIILVSCLLYMALHILIKYDVRPEKFQFLEKGQNRNFDYDIVISVKNP